MTLLHLHDVGLAFRHPLATADGTYPTRRSVIVGYERDGITGWGEAAAFPSGRWGTIEQAWDTLVDCDPDGLPEMPLAAAALQAARRDHAARLAGVPLCIALGGTRRPVAARLTAGLFVDPAGLVDHVARLVGHGAAAVKLKIAPGADIGHIAAVRDSFPSLAVSVDANGAYTTGDFAVFGELDSLRVDLIEQPLPAGHLAACASLRDRLDALVCLDEDIRTEADAVRVLAAGAADVLSLKSMRLGYDTSLAILRRCRDAGVAVKAGGTFDTAVGRHHVLAFATLEGVVDAEAGPPSGYLVDPVGSYPEFVAGTITPFDAPGIGAGPDRERMASLAMRTRTIGPGP